MELTILGVFHDSNKEIEIFADLDKEHPYGFNAIITCKEWWINKGHKDEDKIYEEGEIIQCYNVTEYHHLYSKHRGHEGLACESDIHHTGFAPHDIFRRYSKIEIIKAEKLHTSFDDE